ncbi:MAG: septum formation initiator family protein [Balneolaceae bacterium]
MDLQILNPLRWKRSFLIAILVAFGTVWFLFIDTYSLYTRYELSQRKGDLQERIEQLKEETLELEEDLERLEKSPDLLERIAREEYGMRKPGETVYRIEK